MVLDDPSAVLGCDFHDGEAVLQFAGLVAADELGYGLGGDVRRVLDLPK